MIDEPLIARLVYLSRPTGGAATILLFFFLNLNPHQGKTFREHVRQFDFVGLLLLVTGIICVLIGFNESETACLFRFYSICLCLKNLNGYFLAGNSPATISLLVVGFVVLVIGGIYERWTKRSPIIPPRIFKVCQLHQIQTRLTTF
jgi:hypothetical protein